MLNNPNPENIDKNDNFFIDIYNYDKFKITEVISGKTINSNGSKRGEIS